MSEYSKQMEDKIKLILEKYGVADQRSDAWHSKRGEMLTASEIWKAFGDSTPMARHELIMSKLTPKKQENGNQPQALIWGTRFEPIAKEIYSELEGGIEIVDTTCVQHSEHLFLGASPDGIILTENTKDIRYGRLVEFKCPISRAFDETTRIPIHYWHQMQMQMECTDLYECDYVEMKFKQMFYAEWLDNTSVYKSCFAVNTNTGEVRYRHYKDTTPVNEWKIQQFKEDVFDWQLVFWCLENYRKQLVQRDLDWMNDHLPAMKSVWEEITKHRENNTLPESPKDKGVLVL